MSNENQSIRKVVTRTPLTVSRIYTGDFQKKGTLTAELKQERTEKSYYPCVQIETNLQDNAFGAVDFGFEEKEYVNSNKRVAWIAVPLGSTVESVTAVIGAKESPVLYEMRANRPILTDHQQHAIENIAGVSMDTFADRQVVRYSKDHEKAGQIVLDQNGKVQYRTVFYSNTEVSDVDSRTAEPTDYFASVALKQEMEGAIIVAQEL